MWDIKGSTITLTRGDSLPLHVVIKVNKADYTPVDGDVVRFTLKRRQMDSQHTKYLDEKHLICKQIPINTMLLELTPSDTKNLPFGEYVYDLEITFGANGRVYTFINNAKFILAPEV